MIIADLRLQIYINLRKFQLNHCYEAIHYSIPFDDRQFLLGSKQQRRY